MAYSFRGFLFLLATSFFCARGAEVPPPTASEYHLQVRDLVRVSVFNEPEMNSERRVDGTGAIALPLIGTVDCRGLTVAQAEQKIRTLYVKGEIYVNPQIAITVMEYAVKEVSVIGQVKNPGKIIFPSEDNALEIVDVISKAGGVTRIARSDSVRVTRKSLDGTEQNFTVDVERMFDGRGGSKTFLVLPGDVIFVPERVL